jgi:hypothetical protein
VERGGETKAVGMPRGIPTRKTVKIMGKNYPRVAPPARLKRVQDDNRETVIFVKRGREKPSHNIFRKEKVKILPREKRQRRKQSESSTDVMECN